MAANSRRVSWVCMVAVVGGGGAVGVVVGENTIAMLYSVFPVCGNTDLYLDPFQELLSKRCTFKALH